MFVVTTMSVVALTLSMLMIIIANLISKKTFADREKSSPFECGFDPKTSARIPFSLQFFLVAMIFLIFDVEITLLLPLVMTIKLSNLLNFTLVGSIFLLVLIMGLYHEWNQGALNWAY